MSDLRDAILRSLEAGPASDDRLARWTAEVWALSAPFPLAWSRALEVVPPAEGRTAEAVERRQTREALLGTRQACQAAYEGRPLPARAAEQVSA
jgi:hypothetical protein